MSENDKNSNKIEGSFIASSKVMRFKLGVHAADDLAILKYKYKHWGDQGKLIFQKSLPYFFISYSDIKGETNFSHSVISKNTKTLKEAGLIKTSRQVLERQHYFCFSMRTVVSHKYLCEI